MHILIFYISLVFFISFILTGSFGLERDLYIGKGGFMEQTPYKLLTDIVPHLTYYVIGIFLFVGAIIYLFSNRRQS